MSKLSLMRGLVWWTVLSTGPRQVRAGVAFFFKFIYLFVRARCELRQAGSLV